ncbi:MAG TPA: DNA cytosine methyltransferase [Candidatus Sulfotelmatobacter sp.]|nr:DNA cytosine methyltransferase [Candidatus Sulfotelmatobacter sp.]
MASLEYIDLYAGCGGLSWGLMQSGWQGLFAIEKDAFAFETLRHNLIDRKKHFRWPGWFPLGPHDIDEVLLNYKTQVRKLASSVDLIAGGPPCQGFSVNGRRNQRDRRNRLVDSYVSFVELVMPKLLFFENVRGFGMEFLKNGSGVVYSAQVVRRLKDLGYDVCWKIINFGNYGVPQRRLRFILVGTLIGKAEEFFECLTERRTEFLKKKGLGIVQSVSQAISDLERQHGEAECPDSRNFRSGQYAPAKNKYQKLMRLDYLPKIPDSHRFPRHRPHIVERFEEILEHAPRDKQLSGDLRTKYDLKKRSITPLDENAVCPTITSLPDDYIHYAEPRVLTVRECARIQSFPDDFEFRGKYTSGGDRRSREVPRYTQVGNAIPPLFAELAGYVLKQLAHDA